MTSATTIHGRPERVDAPVFEALTIVGLIGIALIHVVDLGDKMAEAPYLGVAYLGVIAGCAAAVFLLARRNPRGFMVGGRLAAASFIAYNASRTTGLPGTTDDINNWFEPLGVSALIVESAVVALSATALTMARSRKRRLESSLTSA
jgi:hypothetical protein